MSSISLNPVTYGGLSFTNMVVTEVDTGMVAAFTQFPGTDQGISTANGTAIAWGGVNAGVYQSNSSEVLNFNYTVSTGSPSSLIDTVGQLYTTDVFTGPGVHLAAIENVYSSTGVLLGTQTFTQGTVNASFLALPSAQQSVNVQVVLTMSIDSTGTDASEVLISALQQSFGTITSSFGGSAGGSASYSIGSTVWLDSNADGLLDNNEIGVSGVTVELLDQTGALFRTVMTDAVGHYQFSGLDAGTYAVQFLAPSGDSFTSEYAATDLSVINSVVDKSGLTGPIVLAAGGSNYATAVNAGLLQTGASLGSTVWLDSDHDGLLDNGECGVAGVAVELLNSTGTSILGTTTTDASGHYQFGGLAGGTYQVQFLAPTGVAFTSEYVASASAINSAVNSSGVSASVTLAIGGHAEVNAGLAKAALGDYVWLDLNRNGLQDVGDPGVAGVSVQILAADTVVLKISETAYQGDAQYTVAVNGVQIGGTRTATASHATGAENIVTLTGDFGTNPSVVVTFLNDVWGGTATTDRNLYVDGISYNGTTQSASAPLYSNGSHSFSITGSGETVLATTTTNSAGYYAFNDLNAGVYEVKFSAPVGDAFVTQMVGADVAIDSNPAQTTGMTTPITLAAGQVNHTIDAGLQLASGITVLKQPCSLVINQCGQITYSFSVINTGTTALTNVQITDNIGCAAKADNVAPTAVMSCNYNVGDSNHNNILDAGETWRYTETVSQINCTAGSSGSVCHAATGFNLSAGCTAWLHSSFNPTSCADGATYKFQGVACTISGSGVGSKPISVNCADSQVTFSRTCTQATTVYNASSNCWITTLPANSNPGSVFLTGTALVIPSGCNLTNASVTWTVEDASNNCGAASLTWDGGCTGYQSFNQNGCNGGADLNQIGVKSCDNHSGYGNGGSCDVGYGYNGSSYCDLGYSVNGGGCGGSGWHSAWNSHGWQGCGSDDAGTPENLYVNNNCGSLGACGSYTQSCSGYSGASTSGSCGRSGSALQNTMNIAGAADTVTVTAQAASGLSCSTTVTTGTHLTSGCTAWLHSTFRPTSCADGSTYSFKGVSCAISGGGVGSTPVVVKCPDSTISFSRLCSTATTVFNASTNCWVTTLPADCVPGNVFLTGCPQTVASGRDLSSAKITWSIGSSTNNCGASNLNWSGGCTGYSSFTQNSYNGGNDYNKIGVKSCDTITAYGDNSSCAGTPVRQNNGTNCGDTTSCTTKDDATNVCGTTCTAGPTSITVSATDTKEVQVLGCNSNVSINGTATTASLSAAYGAAQTLQFTYTPGNTVSLKQMQTGLAAVTGTNNSSLAFLEISNNANPFASSAGIYFKGEVTTGEKIFADATTNVLTNTAIAGGHFSTAGGSDLYAFVFSSQQAFLAGAAPKQTMAYNTSGSQTMHFGDTVGSLSVIGYVGATGGHLVS